MDSVCVAATQSPARLVAILLGGVTVRLAVGGLRDRCLGAGESLGAVFLSWSLICPLLGVCLSLLLADADSGASAVEDVVLRLGDCGGCDK